jgi:hypothetical protein
MRRDSVVASPSSLSSVVASSSSLSFSGGFFVFSGGFFVFFVLQWWLLRLRCPSVVASSSSLSFNGGFFVFAVLQYSLLYLLHVCEVFLRMWLLADIVGHCTGIQKLLLEIVGFVFVSAGVVVRSVPAEA